MGFPTSSGCRTSSSVSPACSQVTLSRIVGSSMTVPTSPYKPGHFTIPSFHVTTSPTTRIHSHLLPVLRYYQQMLNLQSRCGLSSPNLAPAPWTSPHSPMTFMKANWYPKSLFLPRVETRLQFTSRTYSDLRGVRTTNISSPTSLRT